MVQQLPLWGKLALAAVSGSSFGWISRLADLLDEWSGSELGNSSWPAHTIAAVFAVLVMAPYVAVSPLRVVRILAMCAASAVIYFHAVRFVADGPLSYNTIEPYLVSGSGAALLVGLSVVVLAPRRASWRLIVLCLVAGIIGGAAFEDSIWPGSLGVEIGGHVIWQVLVGLALHLGLRPAPA